MLQAGPARAERLRQKLKWEQSSAGKSMEASLARVRLVENVYPARWY